MRFFQLSVAGLVIAALTGAGLAQITDRTWDGSAGDNLWSTPDNWDPADTNNPLFIPNTGGGTGERAVIGDTAVSRNITTPGSATTISQILWTQSSSGGVNKITLANDLTINHNVGGSWSQSNTTGDPTRMVLDLAGYKFSVAPNVSLSNLTVITSVPGGVFESQLIQGGTGVVGPGVTWRQRISGQFSPGSLSWDPTSTAVITTGTTNTLAANQAAIGNFQIGELASPTVFIAMGDHFTQTVQGNVTIHSNGSNDANFRIGGISGTGVNAHFAVRGDFIDHGPATAANYGGATGGNIAFYGNPVTPSTISIARSLVNNFRIGDNGPDAGGLPSNAASIGNVRLARDLTTTGTMIVRAGSKLDVDDYTLSTGNYTSEAGAIYTFTAGTDTGLIAVTGNLTLNNFTLNVVRDGTWDYLHDLVLFTYTGSFTGSPVLTLGSLPGGFTYGALVTGGGVVKLTNVGLPEPGSAAALGLLGCLIVRRRIHVHQ